MDKILLYTNIDEMVRVCCCHKSPGAPHSLRDKFCGVRAELAELGHTGVEITQEGLQLTREPHKDQDTDNPEITQDENQDAANPDCSCCRRCETVLPIYYAEKL